MASTSTLKAQPLWQLSDLLLLPLSAPMALHSASVMLSAQRPSLLPPFFQGVTIWCRSWYQPPETLPRSQQVDRVGTDPGSDSCPDPLKLPGRVKCQFGYPLSPHPTVPSHRECRQTGTESAEEGSSPDDLFGSVQQTVPIPSSTLLCCVSRYSLS